MKKLLASLIVIGFLLLGCAHTMQSVQAKWGPPAKVEVKGDTTIHYYYFEKGSSRDGFGIGHQRRFQYGTVCVELTYQTSTGKLLSKRQYWYQGK